MFRFHRRYLASLGSLSQGEFSLVSLLSKFQFSRRQLFPYQNFFPSFSLANPSFSPYLKINFAFPFDSLSLSPYRLVVQKFNLSAESVAALRAAIADSIATGQCITVPITDLENTLRFIGCHYDDCDFDCFLNQTTIFGDDPSVPVSEEGDGYEAHFVLNLVCPKETRFTAIFRKPSGEIVTDSLSYHEPMNEALDAAHEDAHRYGWAFVSLQTVTA